MTTKDAVPSDEREFALSIYKPPFRFQHGYIFDAVNHMVVDDVLDGVKAARVRGWGRISYMPDPEKLQDTVGAMIADALTEYWNRRAPTPEVAAQEAGRDAARYRQLRGHGVIFDAGNPGDGARRVFGIGLDAKVDALAAPAASAGDQS
jgi:hypothetical protein